MRRICIIIAALLPLPGIADQAVNLPSEKKANVRLEVRTLAVSREESQQYQNGLGDRMGVTTRQMKLEAAVTLMSSGPLRVKLEWNVIGRKIREGQSGNEQVGARVIVQQGSEDVSLETPMETKKVLIAPAAVAAKFKNFNSLVQGHVAKGSKVEGWVVRLLDESGGLLAVRASADYLSTLALDAKSWNVLVENIKYNK